MALIECPDCGKKISDTVKKCPNCGYHKKVEINKNLLIIVGTVAGIILVTIFIVNFLSRWRPLTKLEQYAVDCIIDYKKMMKNPESLQIHEIRWLGSEKEGNSILIFADTSGQNGFGGNTRDVICYSVEDGKITFIGSSDDDNNWIRKLITETIRDGWDKALKDDDSIISVDRVMAKVNSE